MSKTVSIYGDSAEDLRKQANALETSRRNREESDRKSNEAKARTQRDIDDWNKSEAERKKAAAQRRADNASKPQGTGKVTVNSTGGASHINMNRHASLAGATRSSHKGKILGAAGAMALAGTVLAAYHIHKRSERTADE